ncbi:hypothetical protein J1605_022577 [Eschrichtius robustus]|uniref:Beta-galactosidase-1-like protein 2 n=1 Tax=Eschrichtius robustus TaxID=9764 RepID=A0AB34H7Q7_ESCRO|nr:hypothetical protein J1605_022577 [Eschrichtius robustus]
MTEAGDYTAKYTGLREFFGSISGAPLPAPPDLLPKTAYEPVMPALYLSLWDALPYLEEPVTSEKPLNMENLPINGGNGQSFGYTLYETTITSSGILSACVRDRGQVFVNTVSIGFLDYKRKKIVIPLVQQGFTVLRILVENCGRVNYGTNIDDQRKGLSFFPEELAVLATLASSVLLGAEGMAAWPWSQALPVGCSPVLWKGSGFTSRRPPLQSRVHPLQLHLQFRRVCSPLNTPSLSGLPVWRLSSSVTERTQDTQWAPTRGAGKFHADKWNPLPDVPVFPAFFLGPLLVSLSPCDTFVKLEGWEKGVVFINGQNLGRYWNIGPQETLYLPGAWLDQGLNQGRTEVLASPFRVGPCSGSETDWPSPQVIVFEEKMAGPVVQFTETPYLGRHQYMN